MAKRRKTKETQDIEKFPARTAAWGSKKPIASIIQNVPTKISKGQQKKLKQAKVLKQSLSTHVSKNVKYQLFDFWQQFPDLEFYDRIKLLKEMTEIYLFKVDVKMRREQFEKRKWYLGYPSKNLCAVCFINIANVRHHIIELQNGGPDITENIAFLCNDCHKLVHPWMKNKPSNLQKTKSQKKSKKFQIKDSPNISSEMETNMKKEFLFVMQEEYELDKKLNEWKSDESE